jgi:hypothetical protein
VVILEKRWHFALARGFKPKISLVIPWFPRKASTKETFFWPHPGRPRDVPNQVASLQVPKLCMMIGNSRFIMIYMLNISKYTVNICEVMWNVNLGDGQNPNFKVLGFELSLDPNTTREKSWFSSSPLITNWAEAVSSTDLEDAHFAACWLQLHSGCSGL